MEREPPSRKSHWKIGILERGFLRVARRRAEAKLFLSGHLSDEPVTSQ